MRHARPAHSLRFLAAEITITVVHIAIDALQMRRRHGQWSQVAPCDKTQRPMARRRRARAWSHREETCAIICGKSAYFGTAGASNP